MADPPVPPRPNGPPPRHSAVGDGSDPLVPKGQSISGAPSVPRGGRLTSIPKEMIRRAIDGFKEMAFGRAADAAASIPPSTRPTAPSQVQMNDPTAAQGWMPPGRPQQPIVEEYENVAGRAFDYPAGYNTSSRVRQWEGISLENLRNIAENCDLLRLAIETRKDQLSKLGWSIMRRKKPGEAVRPKADAKCQDVEKCLRTPDGIHTWDQWIRMVAEDSFVLDGVALFRRRTPEGKPFALEVVDATTIMPLIDITGRTPLAPHAAYSQLIKGSVAAQYTRDEMTYWKRNPRSHRVYGFGQVEQVIRTALLALGRAAKQIGHYSEGNVPDMLLSTPATWTGQQVAEFQGLFDRMMQSPGAKRRARFVPGGVGQPVLMNTEQHLFGPFDEWLARVIMYCFSLPPFPFVKETNRSTAEASYDSALSEGLGPFLTALKAMIDREIGEFFGEPDLELVWDDQRKLDPTEQSAKDERDMKSGLASIDDIRAARGQDPVGIPAIVWGIGPMGFLSVEQLKQLIAQNANMPPPPGMGIGPNGEPLAGDPLAGADPALLQQLGIRPPGAGVAPGEAGGGAGLGSGAAPARALPGSQAERAAAARTRSLPEARALIREIEAKLGHGSKPGMQGPRAPVGGKAPGQGPGAPPHGMPPLPDARRGPQGPGGFGPRRGMGRAPGRDAA